MPKAFRGEDEFKARTDIMQARHKALQDRAEDAEVDLLLTWKTAKEHNVVVATLAQARTASEGAVESRLHHC